MLRQIIGWAILILGYSGIVALIVTVHIVDKRDRKKLVDAIRQRGLVVRPDSREDDRPSSPYLVISNEGD